MSKWHFIDADGYQIPVQWYESVPGAKAAVLILPALGTRADYYAPFAEALTNRGYHAGLLEQRGHGKSALRPSKTVDYGFKDAIFIDITATLEWIRGTTGTDRVIVAGHSLGGMIGVAATGLIPHAFDALVLLAGSSPYYKNYTVSLRWKIRLAGLLMPLIFRIWGYFPGYRFGFGGKEARGLMKDWMQLAVHNRFQISGLTQAVDEQVAQYSGPVLSVRFQHDIMAPRDAVAAMIKKLATARLNRIVLGDDELGCRSGHYQWVKHPHAVCKHIDAWYGSLPF